MSIINNWNTSALPITAPNDIRTAPTEYEANMKDEISI